MKYLFINSVCGIRSTGRIVTEQAEKLIAEGHICKIAYGRETVSEKYKSMSYRIGTDLTFKINALGVRVFDNEGLWARKQTKNFIKWANDYNPDVLWLHNLHGYYINIELLFEWIKSRPQMKVKWTLHDCWSFTGHCAHFDYVGCDKWLSGCTDCPQKGEYPKSYIADNSKSNYQRKKAAFCGVVDMTLITPSRWLADLVGKSFLGGYPTEVVHNKIDVNVFKPTKSSFRKNNGVEDKTVVLGVASAWNNKKGLSDFVKLASMLDGSYKIVMVGLTKKQIKKMPKSILCIERTNSAEELAEIYTAADVFVNLTYEDTYPTVNLEALSCGTPCITYRTGGSVESVREDCVAEKGDLDAILQKIKQFKR